MKNDITRSAGFVILCFSLLSCSSMHQPRQLGWNETYTPAADAEEAIIILGVFGDERVGSVTVNTRSPLDVTGLKNTVTAFRTPVGKPFRITSANYVKTAAGNSRYLTIDGPVLTPESTGIYYYGTIFTTDNGGWFTEESNHYAIKLLKKRYNHLLADLEPQNFSAHWTTGYGYNPY